MKPLILSRGRAWLLEGLAWLAFYLTVHFSLNDEQYSFWLPFKFIVAVPQTLFTMAAVYGFGRLFARPCGWRRARFRSTTRRGRR